MISETITLEGHIIDSRELADVLDDIVSFGGEFEILEVHIGQSRQERSHARIEVRAETFERMRALLTLLSKHGALWHDAEDAEIADADVDGAFPEDFFATTNQRTFVRHGGQWIEVQNQEMDCGILHDPAADTFRCVPMVKVRKGDRIIIGHHGVKEVSLQRYRARSGAFEFMTSETSTEKPKSTIIRQTAQLMFETRESGRRLLLVGGPAIVHTGASSHVEWLIEHGYVHVLFAGNALATHDIENNLFGTSLGVYLDKATPAETGHEHHLRAINTIRRAGGIRQAVDSGIITGGIMHACMRRNVELVLAGSIRDDGPLPDVITDALVAQDRMRAALRDVGFVLMVATALHSIATGNILPGHIPAVCVDISPSAVTKLSDRGSMQTIPLVTDVEPFFRSLVDDIQLIEQQSASA